MKILAFRRGKPLRTYDIEWVAQEEGEIFFGAIYNRKFIYSADSSTYIFDLDTLERKQILTEKVIDPDYGDSFLLVAENRIVWQVPAGADTIKVSDWDGNILKTYSTEIRLFCSVLDNLFSTGHQVVDVYTLETILEVPPEEGLFLGYIGEKYLTLLTMVDSTSYVRVYSTSGELVGEFKLTGNTVPYHALPARGREYALLAHEYAGTWLVRIEEVIDAGEINADILIPFPLSGRLATFIGVNNYLYVSNKYWKDIVPEGFPIVTNFASGYPFYSVGSGYPTKMMILAYSTPTIYLLEPIAKKGEAVEFYDKLITVDVNEIYSKVSIEKVEDLQRVIGVFAYDKVKDEGWIFIYDGNTEKTSIGKIKRLSLK